MLTNNEDNKNTNCDFRISTGPAACNVYDSENNQLTIDWAYDSAYYKHNNCEWITISLGSSTILCEIYKINTVDMIEKFKKLCLYAYTNINGYSDISDKALILLKKKLKNLILK